MRSHWHSQPPANEAYGKEASGKPELEQEAVGTVSLRQMKPMAEKPPANSEEEPEVVRTDLRIRFAEGLFGSPHLPQADCATGFLVGFAEGLFGAPYLPKADCATGFLGLALPKADCATGLYGRILRNLAGSLSAFFSPGFYWQAGKFRVPNVRGDSLMYTQGRQVGIGFAVNP